MVKLSYYERRKNAPDGKEYMAERSRREIVKAKERKLKEKEMTSKKEAKSNAQRQKEWRMRKGTKG